jgi:hypothetical protein
LWRGGTCPECNAASPPSLSIGETSLVTITFSEAISGFTNADLTVANGTLSVVSSADGGVTWTATFTPASSVNDATNVITLDNTGVINGAGNAGAGTTDSNNYAVDTTPAPPPDTRAPTSQAAGPGRSNATTWTITYTASNDSSGLTSIDLYAQAPGETTFTRVATDSTIQDGQFAFTGTTDGTYTFHTIATDGAGNVEPAPTSPDLTTQLDTRAPVLRPAMGHAPVRLDLSEDLPFSLRFRVDESVSVLFKIVRSGTAVRTLRSQENMRGVVERAWRGRDDRGRRVLPGRYRVVLVVQTRPGTGERPACPCGHLADHARPTGARGAAP